MAAAAAEDRLADYRARIQGAPFAVLGTHGPGGRLDLVPCCFALDDNGGKLELVTAVDHKPKRHQRLARLTNIDRDPSVTLLVDYRDPDDWTQLWWVRVQGRATVVNDGPAYQSALSALQAKYSQYRMTPLTGPAIRLSPDRWTGWWP